MSSYSNPLDSHLRLSNSIFNELIFRNFSKRQRVIIDLIIRLSLSCGKDFAVIPKHGKFFQLCGVHSSDVKAELDSLSQNNVISWNKEMNIFKFNLNHEEWKISYHKNFQPDMVREIVGLNLQNTKEIGKTPKKEVKNTNAVGEKHKLCEAENPVVEEDTMPPITNIITNNYSDKKSALNILKKIKNYPFDNAKDAEMLERLGCKHSTIDIEEALEAWTDYKSDKPLTKKCSPRSQLATWLSNAEKWSKYPKKIINELDSINEKIFRGEL